MWYWVVCYPLGKTEWKLLSSVNVQQERWALAPKMSLCFTFALIYVGETPGFAANAEQFSAVHFTQSC